jgi:RNA methyltransferase, TrmH family
LREGESKHDFSCLGSLDGSVPVLQVEAALFDRTAHTGLPQGIMALVKRPSYNLEDLFARKPALLLIVDRVQDPDSLGTMIRSAVACGASGVALLPGTVDATNPKALCTAMGAFFRLPVIETGFAALHEAVRSHGLSLLAASGGHCYPHVKVNWRHPVAVVVCNECTGITPEVQAACDAVVSIPMAAGVESLNAVVTMSVIFFEAARQRNDHNI